MHYIITDTCNCGVFLTLLSKVHYRCVRSNVVYTCVAGDNILFVYRRLIYTNMFCVLINLPLVEVGRFTMSKKPRMQMLTL